VPSHDPYAHLRENLAVYRESHAVRTSILWCTDCGYHHADESGLCPVCRPVDGPDLAAAVGDGAPETHAGVDAA
jgi:hypothetical protein